MWDKNCDSNFRSSQQPEEGSSSRLLPLSFWKFGNSSSPRVGSFRGPTELKDGDLL